eukprot:359913-Chlamydomonas_euryale.AAC.7
MVYEVRHHTRVHERTGDCCYGAYSRCPLYISQHRCKLVNPFMYAADASAQPYYLFDLMLCGVSCTLCRRPRPCAASVSMPTPAVGAGAASRASYASGSPPQPVKSAYNAASASRDSPVSEQIDGKQFFQVARSKLSYEQFSQFLHNIKELNAGRQNRDETLMRVRDIFGYQHQDLFVVFEQLLNKAASSFGGSGNAF